MVSPELRGGGEGGSGYYFADLTTALTLRRLTALHKFRARSSYTRSLSGYRLQSGKRIHGDVYGWENRALYALALGKRWALGAVGTARARESQNLRAHAHGGPLVELNAFPYSENANRQLRFAYQAGAWANWYFEVNKAGLMRELRPYHALSMIVDVNQSWGSVQWVGQANWFLDDPRRYRLGTGAVLSVQLFEGFAVSIEGEGALVRDQISLRQRSVTDQELLLWTTQQPTNYVFEVSLSITYTFGSVHNTIVNPRFARVDLAEE